VRESQGSDQPTADTSPTSAHTSSTARLIVKLGWKRRDKTGSFVSNPAPVYGIPEESTLICMGRKYREGCLNRDDFAIRWA
jgi:hypothetical protein